MCSFPQCKPEAAVCFQGVGRKVGNAHPCSVEGEVSGDIRPDKRRACGCRPSLSCLYSLLLLELCKPFNSRTGSCISLVCNWVAGIQHIDSSCSVTATKTEVLQAPGGEAGLNDTRNGPWPGRWPLTWTSESTYLNSNS